MSLFYTLEEVKENNGKNEKPIWIIIKKSIYNVTTFLDEHPGGKDLIEEYSGKDATTAFNKAGHSRDAETMLKQYKIGELALENNFINTNVTKKKDVKRRKFLFCI